MSTEYHRRRRHHPLHDRDQPAARPLHVQGVHAAGARCSIRCSCRSSGWSCALTGVDPRRSSRTGSSTRSRCWSRTSSCGWSTFADRLAAAARCRSIPTASPTWSRRSRSTRSRASSTNTNLQHYSGETGLSYFSQMFVITFLQFVTAATGVAACIAIDPRARRQPADRRSATSTSTCTRATVRVFLPLALVVVGRPDVAGHADDVRGRGAGDDARGRGADHRARRHRRRRVDQAARHQRRRLLRPELGASRTRTRRRSRTSSRPGRSPSSRWRWSGRSASWSAGGGWRSSSSRRCSRSTCRWSSFGVGAGGRRQSGDRGDGRRSVDRLDGRQGSPLRRRPLRAVGGDDDGDVERLGQRDARLADAARRPDAADRHVAEQHLRRRRRRLHQHADLHHRRGVRRRA